MQSENEFSISFNFVFVVIEMTKIPLKKIFNKITSSLKAFIWQMINEYYTIEWYASTQWPSISLNSR